MAARPTERRESKHDDSGIEKIRNALSEEKGQRPYFLTMLLKPEMLEGESGRELREALRDSGLDIRPRGHTPHMLGNGEAMILPGRDGAKSMVAIVADSTVLGSVLKKEKIAKACTEAALKIPGGFIFRDSAGQDI